MEIRITLRRVIDEALRNSWAEKGGKLLPTQLSAKPLLFLCNDPVGVDQPQR
jgi:hypothetical protein